MADERKFIFKVGQRVRATVDIKGDMSTILAGTEGVVTNVYTIEEEDYDVMFEVRRLFVVSIDEIEAIEPDEPPADIPPSRRSRFYTPPAAQPDDYSTEDRETLRRDFERQVYKNADAEDAAQTDTDAGPPMNINGVDVPVNKVTDVITDIAERNALGHVLSELEYQNERLTAENAALRAQVSEMRAALVFLRDYSQAYLPSHLMQMSSAKLKERSEHLYALREMYSYAAMKLDALRAADAGEKASE